MSGQNFDPAILGSVFEKTINHIGGEEGRQKEIGAYYTPNDVTRHLSEQTVDPKVKDLFAEAFVEHSDDDAGSTSAPRSSRQTSVRSCGTSKTAQRCTVRTVR